jgi:hypothetical protein
LLKNEWDGNTDNIGESNYGLASAGTVADSGVLATADGLQIHNNVTWPNPGIPNGAEYYWWQTFSDLQWSPSGFKAVLSASIDVRIDSYKKTATIRGVNKSLYDWDRLRDGPTTIFDLEFSLVVIAKQGNLTAYSSGSAASSFEMIYVEDASQWFTLNFKKQWMTLPSLSFVDSSIYAQIGWLNVHDNSNVNLNWCDGADPIQFGFGVFLHQGYYTIGTGSNDFGRITNHTITVNNLCMNIQEIPVAECVCFDSLFAVSFPGGQITTEVQADGYPSTEWSSNAPTSPVCLPYKAPSWEPFDFQITSPFVANSNILFHKTPVPTEIGKPPIASGYLSSNYVGMNGNHFPYAVNFFDYRYRDYPLDTEWCVMSDITTSYEPGPVQTGEFLCNYTLADGTITTSYLHIYWLFVHKPTGRAVLEIASNYKYNSGFGYGGKLGNLKFLPDRQLSYAAYVCDNFTAVGGHFSLIRNSQIPLDNSWARASELPDTYGTHRGTWAVTGSDLHYQTYDSADTSGMPQTLDVTAVDLYGQTFTKTNGPGACEGDVTYTSVAVGNGFQWQLTSNTCSAGCTGPGDGTSDYFKSTYGTAVGIGQVLKITCIPITDHQPMGMSKVFASPAAHHVFAVSDFGFSDHDDLPANNLKSVIVSTIGVSGWISPLLGTLTNNGKIVDSGSEITIVAISNGQIAYDPPLNWPNGVTNDTFIFQVRDDGGTDHGGTDISAINTIKFLR